MPQDAALIIEGIQLMKGSIYWILNRNNQTFYGSNLGKPNKFINKLATIIERTVLIYDVRNP